MSDTLRAYVDDRDVDAALAAVLPVLLAAAWDEGKHTEHTPARTLSRSFCQVLRGYC